MEQLTYECLQDNPNRLKLTRAGKILEPKRNHFPSVLFAQ